MHDEPTAPRYYNVFGRRVYVTPRPCEPRPPGTVSMPWLIAAVGLAVTALHELVYRQTGGDQFPVLAIISHAGGDMMGLLGILVLTVTLARAAADRGFR